ncbi:MAG: DUF58 domain-containing protein [Spirochaetes bacterium]|nr:DUF58 domain-containing protein [Spirochaetota bacterium]
MWKQPTRAEQVLDRIDWTVIRRLDGLLQGDYRTFFQGFGLDFADIREYQYGDDVRTLDWNVTARMVTPYVRRYHEDRDITAWFLLDLSPSVEFGSPERRKRDLLTEFTAVLSRLLTRRGNKVGCILYDGSVPVLRPPGAGRKQVLTLIQDIQEYSTERTVPETDLSILLEAAAMVIRRRSLIFLISDFYSVPGWERVLGQLTIRNEVTGIRIYDPDESRMPPLGLVWIEDAETGEQFLLDSSSRIFQNNFATLNEKRINDLERTFRSWGLDLLSISTEADLVRELLRFSSYRKLRAGHAARRKT